MLIRGFRVFCIIWISISACSVVFAQEEDFTWWNEIHQWDGITPWVQYLTISSKYMGPNALPVPPMRNGMLEKKVFFQQSAGLYFAEGDRTYDFRTRLYVPFAEGKVALEGWVVPIEFFDTNDEIRDLRAARSLSGKGKAGGDIYFSTHVQLLRYHEQFPDLALELACRTASGTRLRDARYTDGPGYFMNVSSGKKYSCSSDEKKYIRPQAMAGFYSYQTFNHKYPQNDALMYGLACDLAFYNLIISPAFVGYTGYQNNGDRPRVIRCSMNYEWEQYALNLEYEKGVRDYPFQSLHIGIRCYFSNRKS